MNHYNFEDINLKDTVSFKYDITKEKMELFKQITGDENPLHCDLEYAKSHGYNENVVYGMLTASIYSTIAGIYMPGEHSLIHNVEVSFVKPVFISNCPLTVKAEVTEKDERFNQITLKITITDNNNIKVIRGKMNIGFTK